MDLAEAVDLAVSLLVQMVPTEETDKRDYQEF